MVWAEGELSGPVVFRWYRSLSTDTQQPVTLTLGQPYTAVQLRWSPLRTAYESRPLHVPCGRYSATLRVNGAVRPLAPFRVTRYTFEVLLFLSSDVEYRSSEDEPDRPRWWYPTSGSARLRAHEADWPPPSPSAAAAERRHQRLVTQLAGAAILAEVRTELRQLRRQSCANARHVQTLAHELRQERHQRRLADAVRREVARLRAASPQRKRTHRRAPTPSVRKASGERERRRSRSTSPPQKGPVADPVQHRVTFQEPRAADETTQTSLGLETTELEKDFAFEDLCREDRPEIELEPEPEPNDEMELHEPAEELIQVSDADEPDSGGPLGSDSDPSVTSDLDRDHVTGSPPFVHTRTVGDAEVTVSSPPPPRASRLTQLERLLPGPWRPWYPSDLCPGQRAAVLTGGQVIRGDISHIWTSGGHTLVNIETNGWEDVTVPFEKVIMVW